MKSDIVILGAGLTGLTTGFHLNRKGKKILIIEKNDRIGGQIHSFSEQGFTFESGPNTGIISHPEVAELFKALDGECQLETAHDEAKRRLIWKGNKFHDLPSGPISAITTPLFTLKDKFRILGEPFRAKGNNPHESVGELARRRLGQSFVDYAVDPFLSGVYAGDPMQLTTQYALPKLYNLEQNYGSFIKGSIAKAKLPKTDRDKLATKKVFSTTGGLESLVRALAKSIGKDKFILSANNTKISQTQDKTWKVECNTPSGAVTVEANTVITTTGAYALPDLLPFVKTEDMNKISSLYYAPIVQVSVGVKDTGVLKFNAFGGLVPSKEKKDVLGILYPSACFDNRSPQKGVLFSFFIGGVKHTEMLEKSDEELKEIVEREFHDMLKFPADKHPDMIKIFRHQHAIPQYRADSGERFAAIDRIEHEYKGLIIGGNLKGGIGMADRILQGTQLADRACQ